MLPDNPYCDLVDTNTKFNNKSVYRCSYCGISLGLDSPNTKMFCFKKIKDYSIVINKLGNPNYKEPIELKPGDNLQDVVLGEAMKISDEILAEKNVAKSPDNMCTQEQIQARMAICEQCEYYKDNACSLCGCRVVREANYMNKLAHKDQKCPIDKWGKIT